MVTDKVEPIEVRTVVFHGPDERLTNEQARAEVHKRINAWIALSGDKFITGDTYGFGDPSSYNAYYAYFLPKKWRITVNTDWARSVSEVRAHNDHMLCD